MISLDDMKRQCGRFVTFKVMEKPEVEQAPEIQRDFTGKILDKPIPLFDPAIFTVTAYCRYSVIGEFETLLYAHKIKYKRVSSFFVEHLEYQLALELSEIDRPETQS